MDSNPSKKLILKINASPSLSIVIPIYNEAKVLPKALTMLHGLSTSAFTSNDEIIFVDGGSTDQSRALIEAQRYTCLQSPLRRAKQMNAGAKKTSGDIILFLHVDTSLSSSDLLSIKKSYMKGFLSGRFDIKLSNKSVSYRIISFFINLRSRITKISTGDQGIFVRQDIFWQAGGFPDIALMEDVAMSKALRKFGRVCCLHDKLTTSSRRWEKHGVIKVVMMMWKLRLLYWLGVQPRKLAELYRRSD